MKHINTREPTNGSIPNRYSIVFSMMDNTEDEEFSLIRSSSIKNAVLN